jgi:hypothetical protein
MQFTLDTQILDVSVVLNALTSYRDGNYQRAAAQLLEILDMEPNNWQARLMLGGCHYKTGEFASAQRVFRFLSDKCPEQDVRSKAQEGLLACNVKIRPVEIPAEFGCYNIHAPVQRHVSWLDDHAPTQPQPVTARKASSRWW